MATAATSLSSQSMLMAQAGAGENRAGGKLLRTRHCLLLPSPHSLHFSEACWPGTEQSPGAVGRRWMGQSTKGRGPRPKEGGT